MVGVMGALQASDRELRFSLEGFYADYATQSDLNRCFTVRRQESATLAPSPLHNLLERKPEAEKLSILKSIIADGRFAKSPCARVLVQEELTAIGLTSAVDEIAEQCRKMFEASRGEVLSEPWAGLEECLGALLKTRTAPLSPDGRLGEGARL